MATETREILFKLTASEVELQNSLEKVSQSLNDTRQELRELNKSFVAANKIIDTYDDNLDQLDKQLQANEISQEEYNQSVQALNNDLKAANNTVARYAKEQTRLKTEISKLSAEQRGYAKDLRNLEKVTESAEGSNDQLRASVALLTKEYNSLGKEEREASQRGRLLTRTIREQTNALKENESAVGDNRRNVGNYTDALSGLTGGLTDTVGSLIGPGGLIAGITIAAKLIGDGIAAVQEITAEFVNFRGEIQRLTNVSGEDLDALTAKIVNISRVFDEDFNEILIASNALAKQLGITQQEAADLIEQGFLSGANASGELLDILKEYGPQLNAVGVQADQAIALITQQVQEGVFSDKGIDAIKEASEKIALFEDSTQEALAALGIENIEGLEIFEVIQLASEEISKLPAGSKEATAAIEGIFGTPGLDAGFRYISALKDAQESVSDLIDETNPLINLQLQQLEVGQRLAEAQNELSKVFEDTNGELGLLIDEGKIFLIEVLLEIINRLKPVFSALGTFIDLIGRVADAFTFVGDKVNDFLKDLGIINEDIEFFGSAVELVVDTLVNVFTGGFGAIFDAISFAFDLLKDFVGFASTVPDRLSNIFNSFKEFTNELLGTDFEIEPQISLDTTEAEEQIDGLQIKLDDLALPEPVAIDIDEQKARSEAAKLSDAFTEEEIKANEKKKREAEKLARGLKILDQNRLRDEIAGIELRLNEVAKGSLEELNIRKNLLEKQSELAIATRQSTANEVLLITEQTQQKQLELTDQFVQTRLEISVNELEATRNILAEGLTINAEINAQEIDQERVVELGKTNIVEQGTSERIELERQSAQEQRDLAANTLSNITQLTGAFTSFFASQKEKQLEAAAGNAEKEAEINEKFAKREKRLAIFESIINTSVAVVKALPNIPLSILVGTVGAIQTAAIANSSFAGGGFTGLGIQDDPNERGRKIAGVVHDNEYVIPTKVLRRPAGMALALEAERMRGFVDGGFTSIPTFSDGGIGADQAIQANTTAELGRLFKEAVSSLPNPVVNVNEITNKQNRVQTKETTSGF